MQLREEFKGKTVLVTGASMGLGYTCAEYFERCGSQLVITGRTAKKLENLKSSFRSPGDHLAFSGDLLIEREIHDLVEKIKKFKEYYPLIFEISEKSFRLFESRKNYFILNYIPTQFITLI